MSAPQTPGALARALAWAALKGVLGELRVCPKAFTVLASTLVAHKILPVGAEHWVDVIGTAVLAMTGPLITTEPVPTDAIRIKRRPKGSPAIPAKKPRKPRRKKAPAVLPPDAA